MFSREEANRRARAHYEREEDEGELAVIMTASWALLVLGVALAYAAVRVWGAL